MKMSDISDQYFEFLILYSRGLKNNSDDLLRFHGIDASVETNTLFPSEDELKLMRKNNDNIPQGEWNSYWAIIQKTKEKLNST